jgi:hypothetical protein
MSRRKVMLTDSFIGELRNIVAEFQVSVNQTDIELYFYEAAIGNNGLTEDLPGATEMNERKDSPGCGTSDTVW